MDITGRKLIVKAFQEEGVDTIFAYPGGMITDIADELYKQADKFNIVLPRHEQALVHEAEGYARESGKTGVCLVTSGPGATNTITGIADAHYDSIPLVIITGQVSQNLIGNDAFQEVDIVGMTRSIVKYGVTVRDRKQLGRILKMAFYIARTGKPGPVLIDIPKDIQTASGPSEYPKSVDIRGYKPNTSVHIGQLKRAYKLLRSAKKPIILAGGGVRISGAEKELTAFAEKMHIPVVTTVMGKGSMPEDNPLYVGDSGMHGRYSANMAVMECDVLFSIGTRFNDRITGDLNEFAPKARIIHVDVDTASISRNVVVDVPVVSDAKLALENLLEWAEPMKTDAWIERIKAWDDEHPLKISHPKGLNPETVMEDIQKVFTDESITGESCGVTYVTDVGQHQMWATMYIRLRENDRMITSGGLGTMGFGFPAAIGAKTACLRSDGSDGLNSALRPVVCITGDGGMQMNMQEMATAVSNGIPLTVCIINNGQLGMVRQMQHLFYGKRYAITDLGMHPYDRMLSASSRDSARSAEAADQTEALQEPTYVPDFVKWAESYGVTGIRVTEESGLIPVLTQAAENQKNGITTVIDIIVSPDEMVYPMVKGGNAMSEMILK